MIYVKTPNEIHNEYAEAGTYVYHKKQYLLGKSTRELDYIKQMRAQNENKQ